MYLCLEYASETVHVLLLTDYFFEGLDFELLAYFEFNSEGSYIMRNIYHAITIQQLHTWSSVSMHVKGA